MIPSVCFVPGRNDSQLIFSSMPTCPDEPNIALIASLIADPARSVMLWALSDGRTLAAGELSRLARIAPATASAHLAKLVSADLLRVQRSGRHRYYRIARPEVVRALETLATLDRTSVASERQRGHGALRLARTCYDHLAGSAGVQITEALVAQGCMVEADAGYDVTAIGERWFSEIGISVPDGRKLAKATRRHFTIACLDWSERRHHLAGKLGALLCQRALELLWFERRPGTRALRTTSIGRRALRREFGIVLF
jgi:DNA-binding transcriptional ArsR family regulator